MSTTALPMGPWSTGRKALAVVCGTGALMLLAAASLYLSAVLFLLLNKTSPAPARLFSIAQYWERYGQVPKQRSRLQFAAGFSVALLFVALPVGLAQAACQRRPLHGDARFAQRGEVARAGLLSMPADAKTPGILVGRYRGEFLSLPGQLSVMLSAPTRSGKGVGVVIPNLLNWPDSVVVLDIKGENHAVSAGYRAEHCQAVYAFRPFDDHACSHRWNPLGAVRTNPLHRVGDLLAIAQVFFPNDGTGTSSEGFFNDQARNLFLGIGLLLLETPTLPRSLGEMLRQSSGKGQPLKDHLQTTVQRGPPDDSPLSDECRDALQRLLVNSENTLTSIVATFNAPLTLFADAIVDAATSADDFLLADVRRRRMSVYVCVPPHRLASARPLLNLFFSQIVSLNTQALPQDDSSLRFQCLLINDEFAAMGRVGIIASTAAFLAGYNIRLLTVVQAMSQLDALYGEKEARTFATNHGLQILYAPREQRDADEYSAMLGHFTQQATSRGTSRSFSQHGHRSVSRNDSDQRRSLLLPQEFKELGTDRLVILCENCKPILGEKIRYHREAVFRARLRPAPQVPSIDMDLHVARIQQRWRVLDGDDEVTEDFSVDALAHDLSALSQTLDASPDNVAKAVLALFCDDAVTASAGSAQGGSIEPHPDADGVLVHADPTEPTLNL